MEIHKIRDIDTYRPVPPLEIRVIKKWIPLARQQYLCYLFVDVHGDAIEAVADSKNESYFDTKLRVGSCYQVIDDITKPARTHQPAVSHKASLRIGKSTVFTPIHNNNIPLHHFEFASYDMLKSRTEDPKQLRDFIGRVEAVTPVHDRGRSTMRKITLQDDRGHLSEVEGEIPIKELLAVTATSVNKFKGASTEILQLESSDPTTAIINLPILELESYKNRYNNIPRCSLARQSERFTTIVDMLKRKSKQVRFTCEAAITDFDTSQPWYSAKCSICNKITHLQFLEKPSFECKDPFKKQETNIMYYVNGTITDQTGSVRGVFFNESMTTMLNMTCKEMTLKRLNTDPNKTPPELLAIREISYLMNVTLKDDGTVFVNRASAPTTISPNTPNPKTPNTKNTIQTTCKLKTSYNFTIITFKSFNKKPLTKSSIKPPAKKTKN